MRHYCIGIEPSDLRLSSITHLFAESIIGHKFSSALRKAVMSLSGTTIPVFWVTISHGPQGQSIATVGRPHSIASVMTNPNPSLREGKAYMLLFD